MKTMFLTLSLLASAAVASAGAGAALGADFQRSAQQACVMAWSGQASDEALGREIFIPVADQLARQIRTLFGKPGVAPSMEQTRQYLPEGQPPQNANLSELSGSDPEVLANAAGGVADMIAERYRETFREAGEPVPTLITYRSPGESEEDALPRIAEDVRLYCDKLKERGITELYPSGDR